MKRESQSASSSGGKGPSGGKGLSGTLIATAGMVALFWGFSFMAMDILLDTYDPVQILALRWLIAGIIYLILVLTGVIKLELAGKEKKWLILTAISQPCIYSLFETYGVMFTSASLSSIFIATIPSMTLIEGMVLFHLRTSRKGVVGILLAFFGVVCCTIFAPDFAGGGKVWGYLILLVGVTIGSIYAHFSARAGENFSALSITAFMAFVALPWFNTLNFAMGYGVSTYTTLFTDWRLMAGILFLGICCSALAFLGYNKVIKGAHDPAVANNVVSSLVTSVGVLAGVFLRGDTAGWYTVVGVIMTITGVAISSREG